MGARNLHLSLTNIKNESRIFKEAKSLISYGIFENVVVVGLHEVPLLRKEYLDEGRKISLERIRVRSRSLPKNTLFRLVKFMEFVSKLFFFYGPKRFDMVTVHVLALLPVGALIKFIYGGRLVYDAHEYETERHQIKGMRKKIAKIVERNLIGYCDVISVVSESISDEYKRLYPSLSKPFVILNTPPYGEYENGDLLRKELGIPKDNKIFLYQGALNGGRGIEIIVEVFSRLNELHGGGVLQDAVVVFMGYGELEGLVKEAARKYENIYFKEAVSPDRLLRYTASADYGVLIVQNVSLSYYFSLPNKLFEYIMAGLPVLASDFPEISRLVKEFGIGVVVKNDDQSALMEAMEKLVKLDRGKISDHLRQVAKQYSWERQEKILIDMYSSINKQKRDFRNEQ